MKNNALLKCLLVIISIIPLKTAFADEEDDIFSRANCYNNESISYNYFEPTLRVVVSHHIDTDDGNATHYVGDKKPTFCYGTIQTSCPSTCTDSTKCGWQLDYKERHAAIHNSEDSVSYPVPKSSRWEVKGMHLAYTYGVYIKVWTGPVDFCNLHFNQFY